MNQLDLWGISLVSSGTVVGDSASSRGTGHAKGIPELDAVASASTVPVRVPSFDSFS